MTGRLQDIEITLEHRPGALADVAELLGRAGVNLEGGGAFAGSGSSATAHFLLDRAPTAKQVLEQVGIGPVRVRDVVMVKLDQDTPGQLGRFTRKIATAGINVLAQYSDHQHNLVIVVDEAHDLRTAEFGVAWTHDKHGTPRP